MIHPNGAPPSLPEPAAPPPASGPPRGHAWLAWLVIVAVVLGMVWMQNAGPRSEPAQAARSTASLVLVEINLRLAVGGWEALREQQAGAGPAPAEREAEQLETARKALHDHVEKTNHGPLDQRLRAIIAIGEVEGPARAREELEKLRELMKAQEREASSAEANWLDILERLYADYADGRPEAPTVSPEERRTLRDDFGWFGELAVHPGGAPGEAADPTREQVIAAAQRTFRTAMSAGLFAILALVIGGLGLFWFVLRLLRGKVRSRLGPPNPSHALYAETFAAWLILFVVFNLAAPIVSGGRLPPLVMAGGAMALSLVALGWPVIRGQSWQQVRQDVGLTLGQQPLLEPSFGVLAYFLSLPFLLIGLLVSAPLLMRVAATPTRPGDPFAPDFSLAHPIIEEFARGSLTDWVPVFLLGCVVAPIVEEIMFRGVLYRHVRDASRGAGGVSIVVSALLVNLLFAVVHPQGILAVPLLASLACGFVLAREWRGTLLPGILAHAINNTIVFSVILGLSQ